MEKYSILIQWSASGQFIATIPEWPGPRGYGDTREEALIEIKRALVDTAREYYRKGERLPEPAVI